MTWHCSCVVSSLNKCMNLRKNSTYIRNNINASVKRKSNAFVYNPHNFQQNIFHLNVELWCKFILTYGFILQCTSTCRKQDPKHKKFNYGTFIWMIRLKLFCFRVVCSSKLPDIWKQYQENCSQNLECVYLKISHKNSQGISFEWRILH